MPTNIESALTAIQEGNAEALGELVANDPSLRSERDEKGVSLILQALYHRQADLAALLAEGRSDLDIHDATGLGQLERVRRLLQESNDEGRGGEPPVGALSPDGFTPLHYAAFFGHEDVAALILEHGADANAVAENPTKVRPLHSATAIGANTICLALLAAGAEPDARQQGGFTALMAAAMHGNTELVSALLEAGAIVDLQADDGRSALDLAKEGGHTTLAGMLSE